MKLELNLSAHLNLPGLRVPPCSYVNITGTDVVIDAQNSSSLFVLGAGATLRLQGVSLLNGGYHRGTATRAKQTTGGSAVRLCGYASQFEMRGGSGEWNPPPNLRAPLDV